MPVLHSHAADILASTLRSFRLQSQLLNLADKPDVYSLLLQNLWYTQGLSNGMQNISMNERIEGLNDHLDLIKPVRGI